MLMLNIHACCTLLHRWPEMREEASARVDAFATSEEYR
jgi:hypothetical protein